MRKTAGLTVWITMQDAICDINVMRLLKTSKHAYNFKFLKSKKKVKYLRVRKPYIYNLKKTNRGYE